MKRNEFEKENFQPLKLMIEQTVFYYGVHINNKGRKECLHCGTDLTDIFERESDTVNFCYHCGFDLISARVPEFPRRHSDPNFKEMDD
jgi:hypothetical protein